MSANSKPSRALTYIIVTLCFVARCGSILIEMSSAETLSEPFQSQLTVFGMSYGAQHARLWRIRRTNEFWLLAHGVDQCTIWQ